MDGLEEVTNEQRAIKVMLDIAEGRGDITHEMAHIRLQAARDVISVAQMRRRDAELKEALGKMPSRPLQEMLSPVQPPQLFGGHGGLRW